MHIVILWINYSSNHLKKSFRYKIVSEHTRCTFTKCARPATVCQISVNVKVCLNITVIFWYKNVFPSYAGWSGCSFYVLCSKLSRDISHWLKYKLEDLQDSLHCLLCIILQYMLRCCICESCLCSITYVQSRLSGVLLSCSVSPC